MTSTHAVAVAKRLFSARKAGHAGTLDPLASGLLPIAFGEATKTVPFVMDAARAIASASAGRGARHGRQRGRCDGLEPRAARARCRRGGAAGLHRQDHAAAAALFGDQDRRRAGIRPLPRRRNGRDRGAPGGDQTLTLVAHAGGTSAFEAVCGKGTYVRAIARDLGRRLAASPCERAGGAPMSARFPRKTRFRWTIWRFCAIRPPPAKELGQRTTARCDRAGRHPGAGREPGGCGTAPPRASRSAARARCPLLQGRISVTSEGALVALADAEGAEIKPTRIFNLGR